MEGYPDESKRSLLVVFCRHVLFRGRLPASPSSRSSFWLERRLHYDTYENAVMNRSWFRNPFGSSTASANASGPQHDEDELLGDGAEQLVSASKRKRRKNNKAGGTLPRCCVLSPRDVLLIDANCLCLSASTSDTSASTSYASSSGEHSNFRTDVRTIGSCLGGIGVLILGRRMLLQCNLGFLAD